MKMSLRNDDEEILRDTYKHIELFDNLSEDNTVTDAVDTPNPSPKPNPNPSMEKLCPCVSFDTVPCAVGSGSLEHPSVDFPGVQLPPELSLDDLRKDEEIARRLTGIHHDYFSPSGPSSQNTRFTRKSLADSFKRSENGRIVRVDYPSEPAVINDALVLTKSIRQWHGLWAQKKKNILAKLDDKNKWFQYPDILFPRKNPKSPVMSSDGFTLVREQTHKEKNLDSESGHLQSPRTILCHISGRRHTWVALDWSIRQLARNTDHIVVVANLPKFAVSSSNNDGAGRSKFGTSSVYHRSLSVGPNDWENEAIHQGFLEWTSGYNKNDVEGKIADIFRYIRVILPPSLVIKITVEIVVGKTKKVMLDTINCYTPDFCVAATLKWERTDNLIVWKSRFLKDILCTKFPIPVFVVPAKRMYEFEASMERASLPKITMTDMSNTHEVTAITSKTSIIPNNSEFRDEASLTHSMNDRNEDGNHNVDITDLCNDDKLTIGEKLRLARERHRKIMLQNVRNVGSNDKLNHFQKNLGVLDGIITGTLLFSEELRVILKKDFEGADDEEIHYWEQMINASTRVVPSSKRSMLDVLDTPKSSSPRQHHHHRHHHQTSTPHNTLKPRSSQIKFASNVNSKDGHKALGKSRSKNNLNVSRPSLGHHSYSQNIVDDHGTELRKVNSGDSTSRIPLRKVVSANGVTRVRSNDSYSLSPIFSSGSRSHHSKKHGTDHGHHSSLWGEGAGGLLSFLKPTSSRSSSRSRHNSDSDSSERGSLRSVKSHHEVRKKKSFFGW